MQEQQEFNEWNQLKQKLHNSHRIPRIKEHEIWWCAVGKNIGVEINGKNQVLSRPKTKFSMPFSLRLDILAYLDYTPKSVNCPNLTLNK